jgi:hypothetical protein
MSISKFGPPATMASQCEANARLIAAAPDMAEALGDVVRWLDNTGTLYSSDKLIPHLRKVLAKAAS